MVYNASTWQIFTKPKVPCIIPRNIDMLKVVQIKVKSEGNEKAYRGRRPLRGDHGERAS